MDVEVPAGGRKNGVSVSERRPGAHRTLLMKTTRRHLYRRLGRSSLLLLLLALAAPTSAKAVWGAPVTLSDPGRDAVTPLVGVDPSGNAVFVWAREDETTDCGGGCLRIQARARSASGVLRPTQTLSAAGQRADDPRVGVDQ